MYKIAISGKANSGKNTVSNLISSELFNTFGKAEFLAFADPIKKMIEIAYPNLPKEYLYGSSNLRSKIIPGAFKNEVPLSVRQLLIDLGNDFGRMYKKDIWISNFDYHFNKLLLQNHNVIVTDLRFRNEFDHLSKLNFYKIRIIRSSSLVINNESETNQELIKDSEFDCIIDNNCSLDDLSKQVKNICKLITVSVAKS